MKNKSFVTMFPWILFFVLSIVLVYVAGGKDLLENKSLSGSNLMVVGVGGVVALISFFRILGGLIPKSTEIEAQSVDPELAAGSDDFILCVHCGKAEPVGTEYCSSCGRRFG